MKKILLSILFISMFSTALLFADKGEYRVQINDKAQAGTSRAFECAAVIAHYAGFPEYNDSNTDFSLYDSYFIPLSKNKAFLDAVSYFNSLHNRGFSYDAVANIATYLNSDCQSYRTDIQTVKANIQSRCGDPVKFLEVISTFYTETSFDDFYQSMIPIYEESLQAILANIQVINIAFDAYEKYYRTSLNPVFISVTPLVGPSNYGVSFNDGQKEYYEPKYCAGYFDANLLIHELSHPMSNPVVYRIVKNKKIMKLVNKSFKGTKKQIMQQQAYTNSETYLIELFNRANTLNILKAFGNDAYIYSGIFQDKLRRFDEIDQVTQLLDKYRLGNYVSLEEFRPELEEGFLKILNANKNGFKLSADDTKSFTLFGKTYNAQYCGTSDVSGIRDFKTRKVFRLIDAYEDLVNYQSFDYLSDDNYPVTVNAGEVYRVEYLRTDGTGFVEYMRSDANSYINGQHVTVGIYVE